MTGEQPGDEGAADPRTHTSRAGSCDHICRPAINIVLAIGLLSLFMLHYEKGPNAPGDRYLAPDAPQ